MREVVSPFEKFQRMRGFSGKGEGRGGREEGGEKSKQKAECVYGGKEGEENRKWRISIRGISSSSRGSSFESFEISILFESEKKRRSELAVLFRRETRQDMGRNTHISNFFIFSSQKIETPVFN